ncbi:MAG: M1 family metallopeptidase [Sphingomonadales bacterium]|nr:M1 family metallopeptidase [Sphingomonadales bacterium]
MRSLMLAGSLLALALGTQAEAKPKPAAPAAPAAPAPAPAPAEAVPPMPEGKLTDAVKPSLYRLDLTVDPARPRFSGHVEIDATLARPSRHVYLHGRDLAVSKAVALVGGRTVTGEWKQVDPTGVVLLTFPEQLPAGTVTFAFDYDAAFQDGPAGMFRVKVGDDWYAWTQFESIDARAAYPSFDQPGYKQPFRVTLRTPAGLKAISNAPETGVTQADGMDVHAFADTAPLPTYLLAMMVGPYVAVEGAAPPTPQRATPLPMRIVSTRPNAAKLAFALENSKQIVALLEDYFGQAFPYPKLDQITSPIMPGAMENAGADVYQDSLLVLDDKASTAQKRAFGMVVSHELAHQWFGDLVTPAWWDDIWLNESFANWMGYRIGNVWRPDLNLGAGALEEGFAAMGTDALVAGRPIHQPITRNAQVDAAFDTITYGKGGQVVAMIAAFMGDAKFRDGVRAYMAAHRYGNATSADFFKAMADVAGDPRILPAMQSFTDQQGVPLLTFAGAKGKYTVTQSRYARLGANPPPTRWGVPMCLRMGTTRQCTLLDQASADVALAGSGKDLRGPLMPNAGGTGYYRFELPRAEWDKLIAASATLPAGEALALADSLRASFQAGRGGADLLVALARTMSANTDSYASDAALDGVESLEAWGMLDKPAEAALRGFVARVRLPQLAKLGFDPRLGAHAADDADRAQRRIAIVRQLADAEEPGTRARLQAAASAWLGGDDKALDPSFYGPAFDAAIRQGGIAVARTLLDRALASQDPLFRPSALAAIARSGNAGIAGWVLNDIKDQRLRTSEHLSMVAGVVASAKTRDLGYNWMRDHVDSLLTGGAGIFFSSRLPQFFAGYCSVEKADGIRKDFAERLAGRSSQLELDRTIERVRACGMLKEARAREASAQVAQLR